MEEALGGGHAKVLLREGKAKANQARTDKFTEGSTALKNGSRRTGALSGENQTQHLIAKGGKPDEKLSGGQTYISKGSLIFEQPVATMFQTPPSKHKPTGVENEVKNENEKQFFSGKAVGRAHSDSAKAWLDVDGLYHRAFVASSRDLIRSSYASISTECCGDKQAIKVAITGLSIGAVKFQLYGRELQEIGMKIPAICLR